MSQVSLQAHTVDGKDLYRVHAQPSALPVDATVNIDKKGRLVTETNFYIRVGNGTKKIPGPQDKQRYISGRLGTQT